MTKKNIIRRLLAYLKPYYLLLIVALVFSVAAVAGTLLLPYYTGETIDLMVASGFIAEEFVPLLIKLGVSAVVAAVATYLLNLILNNIIFKVALRLRKDAFDSLSSSKIAFTDAHKQGEIVSRITGDVDTLTDGVLSGANQLFTGVMTIIATLAVMFVLDYRVALVVLCLTPLSVIVARFITRKSYLLFKKQAASQGAMSGYLKEQLNLASTLYAFGKSEGSARDFIPYNDNFKRDGGKAYFYSALVNPVTRFVNNIVSASVVVLGSVLCLNNVGLSVGILSVFISYTAQYTKPFNEISGVIATLQNAFSSSERVFEVIDAEKETTSGKAADFSGKVEFDNVCFSYTEKPFIEGLHFTAERGEKVAIVGPTGCGKTTLINLLMRFYPISGGSIKIDGEDIGKFELSSYRREFGMVLQDTFIEKASVIDNVAYSSRATRDEVEKACETVGADFIENLPDGYDTVIDSGMLSTGEKQIICLARVMLLNPRILILDEATSNIDTLTELKVKCAFDRLTEGRTSIVIAHRLSTIIDADCILVMKDGKIIESGRHSELINRGGFYAELYNSRE